MAEIDRLTALCELGQQGSPPVTGIDFIQVVDPAVQTTLRVFFIVDPRIVGEDGDRLATVPGELDPLEVQIRSVIGSPDIPVLSATWLSVDERTVLEVETERPGSFERYRMTLLDPGNTPSRFDPFFNGVEFSFKQGCPSVFDCREREPECPPDEWIDFPIDYLARDFDSLRSALLDFAAQRYPDWSVKTEADLGVMIMELMAALGDEFSYIQDRYAREAYLATATQRRSLRGHTWLIDYQIAEGLSASTHLAVEARNDLSGDRLNAGERVWAHKDDGRFIPFEFGNGLRDSQDFWVHPDWNAIEAHVPDPSQPCLPIGSSEIILKGTHPDGGRPETAEEGQDSGDWIGRLVFLKSKPTDPSLPERAHLVRIVAVERGVDHVCLNDAGEATEFTIIRWSADEATPFEFFLPRTTVCANVVPATAGETFESTHEEHIELASGDVTADFRSLIFAIGTSTRRNVPTTIERQGPCNEITGERSVVNLYSLLHTEQRGLGWLKDETGQARPEVQVFEFNVTLDLPEEEETQDFSFGDEWRFVDSLLNAKSDEQRFTLEHGTWRTIFRVDRNGFRIEHPDYASGEGHTVRFGDGDLGQRPTPGRLFCVKYRTDVGKVGNVTKNSITVLRDPLGRDELSTTTPLSGRITSVTNPLPVTSGVDPQSLEAIRQQAPEAFKAETFFAVRDEDYRAHAERVTGIQKAGAKARWTGSWLTEFVTVDPAGAFSLSEEVRDSVADHLDSVRQAGRDVAVKPPKFLDIDLTVRVCAAPSAYKGQVHERVVRALTVSESRNGQYTRPFFHPDNFTFGTVLRRSDLEAAVQAVPGVRGVLGIDILVRGIDFKRRLFTELELAVSDDQILRLQNDRRQPEKGSLEVIVE